MDPFKDMAFGSEITCPWCYYEFKDSWKFESDNHQNLGLIECKNCGKSFHTHREIEITYVSKMANNDSNERKS